MFTHCECTTIAVAVLHVCCIHSVYMYTCAQIPHGGKIVLRCLNLTLSHTFISHMSIMSLSPNSHYSEFSNLWIYFVCLPLACLLLFPMGGRILRLLRRPHMWYNLFSGGRCLLSSCQGGKFPPLEPVVVNSSA